MHRLNKDAIAAIKGLETEEGNQGLYNKMYRAFEASFLEGLPALRNAVAAVPPDFPAISKWAHKLKSSSAYLGAEILSGKCRDLEAVSKQGKSVESATCLIHEIEQEFRAVHDQLDSQGLNEKTDKI